MTLPWTPDPAVGALDLLPALAVPTTGRRGRVAAEAWAAIIAHTPTRARYAAMTCQRGPGRCWHWTGTVGSSGHGSFQAEKSGRTVIAHLYGWHLSHGPGVPGGAGTPG